MASTIANGWNRCTPPATKKTRPLIGQSSVARYATNGATFAGSIASNASPAGFFIPPEVPGDPSVRRGGAGGGVALGRGPGGGKFFCAVVGGGGGAGFVRPEFGWPGGGL